MSSSVVSLTRTCTPPRDQELNPFSSAWTVYIPGGRKGMLYLPSSLVCAAARTPVVALTAEMVAPGITAFDVSTTRPRIVPLGSWPAALPAAHTTRAAAARAD